MASAPGATLLPDASPAACAPSALVAGASWVVLGAASVAAAGSSRLAKITESRFAASPAASARKSAGDRPVAASAAGAIYEWLLTLPMSEKEIKVAQAKLEEAQALAQTQQ